MKGKNVSCLLFCGICVMLSGVFGCGQTATVRQPVASEPESSSEPSGQEIPTKGEEEAQVQDLSSLYVITRLDTEHQVLELERVSDGKWFSKLFSGATYFYDRYGKSVVSDTMECGQVVQIKENEQTGKLAQVTLATQVWEKEEVQGFQMDLEQQTIKIQDQTYYYGSNYWVYANNSKLNLKDITDQDTLAVWGIDKKIIAIQVTKGHGVLTFKNTELFDGGWLQIGKRYEKVQADLRLELPEGTYDLSVAKDGYGDTKEVTVERGKAKEIDLNEYKGEGPKIGTITFQVDVPGAVLKINGETVDYSQPLQLRYGTYGISLSADGYDTIQEYLVVSSATATIELTMTSNEGTSQAQSTPSEETGSAPDTKQDTEADSVTPGALAGTRAGTKTGGATEEKSSTETLTDPFVSLEGSGS